MRETPDSDLDVAVVGAGISGLVTAFYLGRAGRRVAVLCRGRYEAGRHDITWQGCDHLGRPQPSGTYLYRLQAAGRVESRAMVLVR